MSDGWHYVNLYRTDKLYPALICYYQLTHVRNHRARHVDRNRPIFVSGEIHFEQIIAIRIFVSILQI